MRKSRRLFIAIQKLARPLLHPVSDRIQANRILKKVKFRFPELALGPKSVIIDLGSNVGHFSLALANSNAQIICLEPNPFVFARSVNLLRKYKNVQFLQVAATNKSARQVLFFHKDARLDSIKFSISASTMKSKYNIDQSSSCPIIGVGLQEILDNFTKVDLLKCDIEGGEIQLLDIFKKNCEKIDHLLMETHEDKMLEGNCEIELFRSFISENGLNQKWLLDWE